MVAWTLQHVALAAALTLVVAVVCRVSRPGPVTRHLMWVIVLVQLLTPPLVVVESPWVLPDRFAATQEDQPASQFVDPDDNKPGDASVRGATRLAVAPATSLSVDQLVRISSIVWVAGTLVFALLQMLRLARLASITRTSAHGAAAFVREVEDLARIVRVPAPAVRVVEDLGAPMVWSMSRPTLLWPARFGSALPDVGRRGLIIHELAHLKRRDHWVGWLELAGACAWWWNPLFWYVRAQIREHAELACDAWVANALPDGRRAYAEALLAVSAGMPIDTVPLPTLGARAGSRRMLERRLIMIMRDHVALRYSRTAAVGVALFAALTIPVWAQKPEKVEKVKPLEITDKGEKKDSKTLEPKKVEKIEKTEPAEFGMKPNLKPQAKPKTVRNGEFEIVSVEEPQRKISTVPVFNGFARNIPDDAKKLVSDYQEQERAAQAELEQKLAKGRETTVRDLQALQEKYTKAGQLDEAIAIRDQIRMLEAGRLMRPVFKR